MITKTEFFEAMREQQPGISEAQLVAAWALFNLDLDAFIDYYGHLTI